MDARQKDRIPPQTQIGDYRVVGHFASGGMGDVYEVVNPLLREFFAMKVLREDEVTDSHAEAIQNFLEEGRTTVRLRHNNIVTLHTMGQEPIKGRLYFIMDYIGLSPARRTEVLRGNPWFPAASTGNTRGNISRTPLSLEDVLRVQGRIREEIVRVLALDIARALHYAHTFREGCVIHCDLKPGNVLLREDGHAVIADFGIARAHHPANPDELASTSIRGTPDYMAPEQWDPDAELTPATDIYAYGVMLCRLLTGTLPVGIWKRPSELGMNPGWDVLIERCIRKKPEERWGSMHEIILLLRNLPAYAQRAKRRKTLRKALFILGGSAAALLAAGLLLPALIRDPLWDGTYAYTWHQARIDPDAFVDRNLIHPVPHPSRTGELVYSPQADPILRNPATRLSGVNVLVLPKQVSGFEPHFFDCFPRLEYIVCDSDNPTFFAQDGILYRRGNPDKAEAPEIVAIPPKLHGEITVHAGVTRIEVPWPDATLSGNTLSSHGAYGRPLILTATDTVTWVLPKM